MKTYDYKSILAVAALLLTVAVVSVVLQRPNFTIGSIQAGQAYESTTTPQLADLSLLCAQVNNQRGPGVLGQVVLTGPNLGEIIIYDATTSNSSLRALASSSLDILFNLPVKGANATATLSSFVLDVSAKDGLLVDYVGSGTPTTTIAYRCGE